MKGIFPQTLKEPYLVPSRLIFLFFIGKMTGTHNLKVAIVSTFPVP